MEPKVSQRLSVVNSQRATWRVKAREGRSGRGTRSFVYVALYKHSPFPVAHDQQPSALVGRPGHVRAGCKWEVLVKGKGKSGQSGGKVGMQICWLYLHAFTGVCETQCVSVWVCELAVCACTCCLSKNYAPRSPMPQSIRASCSSRRRRQPNIAKLLPARPLPCPFPRRRPLSQFVCHSANCFCGLHCKFATLSARVQQLATFKCVSKISPSSLDTCLHLKRKQTSFRSFN